jgi:hypothetical protein
VVEQEPFKLLAVGSIPTPLTIRLANGQVPDLLRAHGKPVHPHLDRCLAIVLDVTAGVGDEATVRRDPNKWSVVEIVEHLTRAYSGTAKGFERCLEKGAPLASAITLKQSLQQFALINLGYFPEGRQAPKHIIPTGELDLNAVLDALRRDLARLDEAARKTRQALGAGKMLDHPILGPLTIDQWLRFHVVHTRHHAKQIAGRR